LNYGKENKIIFKRQAIEESGDICAVITTISDNFSLAQQPWPGMAANNLN